MSENGDVLIRDIIANASASDLIDGLARRGAVTRRLSGGVVKVSVKLKEPTRETPAGRARSPHRQHYDPDVLL